MVPDWPMAGFGFGLTTTERTLEVSLQPDELLTTTEYKPEALTLLSVSDVSLEMIAPFFSH